MGRVPPDFKRGLRRLVLLTHERADRHLSSWIGRCGTKGSRLAPRGARPGWERPGRVVLRTISGAPPIWGCDEWRPPTAAALIHCGGAQGRYRMRDGGSAGVRMSLVALT